MRLQKSPALSDNSPMGSMAREDVRNKISQEEEIVESLTARYKKLVQEKWKALNPNTPKTIPPEAMTVENVRYVETNLVPAIKTTLPKTSSPKLKPTTTDVSLTSNGSTSLTIR